jgi:glyoxylase-like metal-dependent hydrolase (beta-lactamase superfamily II)
MKIHVIDCGNFKADGGAVFGVVPKTMWSKSYPADENNLCNLSMRSLLVETGNRKVLIDTGTGNKQDERFFKYHYLNGQGELIQSLKEAGFSPEDITDVVHTHLHFDHCGGTIKKDQAGNLVTTFPNANLWVSKTQWEWAVNPNKREAPAYPPENILPMEESGKLMFVETEGEFIPGIEARFMNGHTRGQIIPILHAGNKKVVYCGDLIPTMANTPLSFVSAYDLFQLDVLEEKEAMLEEAVKNEYILCFEHDLYNEACILHNTPKGIRIKQQGNISDFIQ